MIDSSTTCADIFNHHVITSGSMIAVRQDAQFLTYQELASRAGAVAEQLRFNGIGQGNIVATLLARSPLGIIVALACWSIGAVYVHINEYEPENRVEALLSIAHADLVVTDNKNENRIGEFVKLNVEKTATR
ncbi:AMP-binding protein [Photorhabdus sp. SF281]|uniref:AMP-binding protein n=1 Tax=Photorhabdus sp. SF281 TaxID=3459527 RepID=UPI004044A1C1